MISISFLKQNTFEVEVFLKRRYFFKPKKNNKKALKAIYF